MTDFKGAYSAFTDYVARQKATIASIRTELGESKAQIKDTEKELDAAVSAAFPSLDAFPVVELSEASLKAGLNRNFTLLLSAMRRDNAEKQEKIEAIVSRYGTYEAMREAQADRAEKMASAQGYAGQVATRIKAHEIRLADFNASRKEIGKDDDLESINAARAYFTTPTFFRRLSPAWHRGHDSVQAYEKSGTNVVNGWEALLQSRAEKRGVEERIAGIASEVGAVWQTMATLQETAGGMKSDAQILGVLHENLVEALFDEKFVDAMAEKLGRDAIAPVLVPVLKIHNLHKISHNLADVLEKMGVTLDQLEKPLDKLKRGASRAPNKSVDLDLDPIEAAIRGQEAFATRTVRDNAALRSGIRDYSSTTTYTSSPPDNNFLLFMNQMMLWQLMTSTPDCTPGFVPASLGDQHSSLTLPDGATGLAGSFNDGATFAATSGLDGAMNVSMPSGDLASFSVPDVSIPNSSSYDGGGSSYSSYDSGGSSYSSSSYDSGSSSSSSFSDGGGGGMSI